MSANHPNARLIVRFYTAFQALDAPAMVACYHPDVEFSDPAFPSLRGQEARAMWALLCTRAREFSLEFAAVDADEERGRAHWEPRYRFGAAGRRVHNVIDAEFTFRDGLIVRHVDRFDFWRWARQALGPAGLALGWTPFLQRRVQAEARRGLDAYVRKRGPGPAPV